MFRLEHSIKSLSRVGLATARHLDKLGVHTVQDLLYFFPFRYEDPKTRKKISEVSPDEMVVIEGVIDQCVAKISPQRRMRMTEMIVNDGTDSITAIFFNQPYIAKKYKSGQQIVLAGKVSETRYGLQLQNPSIESTISLNMHDVEGLQPVYHLSGTMTQKQIRFLTQLIMNTAVAVPEWMPSKIKKQYQLCDISSALKEIHYPTSPQNLAKAKERLSFDELLMIMLRTQISKKNVLENHAQPQTFVEEEIVSFVKSLPFTLTDDQKKAAWVIFKDLAQSTPMHRMLEGDVGSGKTVVAALALFHAFLNNQQGIVMVPTSVLAGQHYVTLQKMLSAHGVKVGMYTQGKQDIDGKKVSKKDMLDAMKSREVDVVVGTQALISDDVYYNSIGLVVVDEQHRFGVEQRKTLKERNLSHTMPHFLSMTATPIPRSLALILYGDLSVSILEQKPAGRKDIVTRLISERQRSETYDFVKQQIKEGRQVFVICPLIDPSDTLGVASVTEVYTKLVKESFKGYKIAMIHGKFSSKEKDVLMQDFKDKKYDILVATSVIEVGVDVPNATIMLIEGAQRFGLAQLHQFRGRVGRSDIQSYCFLIASEALGYAAQQRLAIMEKTNNGFILAEHDLKVRGPGEVFGTRQSGIPEMKISDIHNHALLQKAQEAAIELVESNEVVTNKLLAEKLVEAMGVLHLE